ncbi:DUF3325 domain-containing protein [Pseudomonas sp. NY15364]|uniref:DUF3325 domain-containing protein n=1 Tax=Pseudomonas sp. NY15364 TaxID=3400353 RepID=UPI003A8BC20A
MMGALLLAYVGMSALCMGLERSFRQVFKHMPSALSCRCLRALGWLLLVASLAFSVRMWGVAAGIVGWVGVMSVAGVALIMLLPYAPRVALALPGFAGLACTLIRVLP